MENHIRSFLEVRKAPQPSCLTRKRVVDCNPPVGRKKSRGQGSSEPKSVSPKDRVNEFPTECLTVSGNGHLFCNACREEISLRKNIITSHISCKKHKTSKEKLAAKDAREKDISISLKAYDTVHHPKKVICYSMKEPGITYYFQQVSTDMKDSLEAFKAARLFSPFRLTEINPSISSIDSLTSFPFLTPEISALKQELPLYQAAVNPSYDPLLFWKNHEIDLPVWAKAARQVLLVQPSSAASERVFSLLRNSFGKRQSAAIQDYIETSLMLQYNNR